MSITEKKSFVKRKMIEADFSLFALNGTQLLFTDFKYTEIQFGMDLNVLRSLNVKV